MEKKTAYKGFDVDENGNLYCQHGNYPRKYYKIGEMETVPGELRICGNGMHFCWNLNDVHGYYNLKEKVICEVEILGDVVNESDMKKSCTNKLIIKQVLTKEQVFSISNTGNDNTGLINSGNGNSGNRNSGNGNSGNRNSGDWNSGNGNSGDWNSGNGNSGNWNSGDWNSGDWNSGNRNSGNRNSGDWNSCDYSNGIFCTESPKISLFNTPSDMTMREFINTKFYDALTSSALPLTEWVYYTAEEKENDKAKELIGGYLKRRSYKEACNIWWDNMDDDDKETIISMSNFNADIFNEITGIKF